MGKFTKVVFYLREFPNEIIKTINMFYIVDSVKNSVLKDPRDYVVDSEFPFSLTAVPNVNEKPLA